MLRKALSIISIYFLTSLNSFAGEIIVKPGETLSEIAEKNRVSIELLIETNKISNPNSLMEGQVLRIPEGIEQKPILVNGDHLVSKGETIYSIANRYGIDKIDIIVANNLEEPYILREGQIIRLPLGPSQDSSSGLIPYKVKAGDSLSRIAELFGISQNEIINQNKLTDLDLLHPGQILYIEKEEILNYSENNEEIISGNSNILYEIESGDTLSSIAYENGISLGTLLSYNNITNPNEIAIGDFIIVKKFIDESTRQYESSNDQVFNLNIVKETEWKEYGPIKVDWSNWQYIDNNYITLSMHKEGRKFYLAINCEKRKLNATGSNWDWKNWVEPKKEFEQSILNDLCLNQ